MSKTRPIVFNLVLVSGLAIVITAFAHEPEKAVPVAADHSGIDNAGMPAFVKDIDPAAADAVNVVDAFSTAIKAVKLDQAEQLLDPQVLILESGSSERSRDEYMGGHAIADAAFMQTAHQQLRYRQARAAGDIAWVCTESLLHSMKDGKMNMLLSTETMVLRKSEDGWKIVHIHWSSRPAHDESEHPHTES